MKIVKLAIATVLLTAAFSGCISFKKGGSNAATASDAPSADNETMAMPAAPTAAIVVSMAGNVSDASNGSVAAASGANVTFDGSSSTGSNLTFAWDFGDNTTIGTIPASSGGNATGANESDAPFALDFVEDDEAANSTDPNATAMAENASVEHAFAAPGLYNVTLYVTDDHQQTATASVTINVTTSGPAPGTWLRDEAKDFGTAAGSQALVNGACGTLLSKEWALVDVEANGTASTARKVVLKMGAYSGTGLGGYTKLSFKDPAGKVVKEITTGTAAKTLTIDGPLPAGKYKVEAAVCASTIGVNVAGSAVTGVATYVVT